MPFLTSILVLLVVARLLGELMVRLKQPAIVGEILAGILLGPAVLGYIQPTDHLAGISELTVFLIVLTAGLEMEFGDVIGALRGLGLMASSLGFVIPFGCGILLGVAFGFDVMKTVFLGLCISITALPVAVRILDNFKLLNTPIASYSIATSILNDIAALLLLGIVLEFRVDAGATATFSAIGLSAMKTAAKLSLFGLAVVAASRLLRWGGSRTGYIERAIEKVIDLFGKEALFGVAVLFVLIFGSMSETLGSHFVIGAFFGALLLSHDVFGTSLFSELKNTIHSITGGFLAPIFFAFLGLQFSVSALISPLLPIAVLLVSVFSKILAGWLGARWVGMDKNQALGVGIILNGRGIMELVVADIALRRGLINQELFSTLVLMGVVTTMLTPILFRRYVLPRLGY